jgi:hypothetical protein
MYETVGSLNIDPLTYKLAIANIHCYTISLNIAKFTRFIQASLDVFSIITYVQKRKNLYFKLQYMFKNLFFGTLFYQNYRFTSHC